jgi:H2-forming N5,N10-methylenetetrahydromethanopterin dehydrogenase-like enzyme
MHVKVLGTGGAGCDKLAAEVRRALRYVGLEAKLSRVEDSAEIESFHPSGTPALVINGELKVAGRMPDQAELTSWLTTAALAEQTC